MEDVNYYQMIISMLKRTPKVHLIPKGHTDEVLKYFTAVV